MSDPSGASSVMNFSLFQAPRNGGCHVHDVLGITSVPLADVCTSGMISVGIIGT